MSSSSSQGDSQKNDGSDSDMYEWPAVSSARLRAGLRSALKTDCSGFLFQNGGRSLRWFRERKGSGFAAVGRAHAAVLWNGHISLLAHSWDALDFLGTTTVAVWSAFRELEQAYRARYGREHYREVMARDGGVGQAVRWLCSSDTHPESADWFLRCWRDCASMAKPCAEFPALALVAGWTDIVEMLQTARPAEGGGVDPTAGLHPRIAEARTRFSVLLGAVLTASLPMVEAHWADCHHDGATNSVALNVAHVLGQSGGSPELLEWVFAQDIIPDSAGPTLVRSACAQGELGLLEYVRRTQERSWFNYAGAQTIAASSAGHLRLLEWIVRIVARPSRVSAVGSAAEGHVEVVRFLHTELSATLKGFEATSLVQRSPPACLATLEYIVEHFNYRVRANDIVYAATAANVRADVLQFLLAQATPTVCEQAYAHDAVARDLQAQDWLHAAKTRESMAV